MRIIIDLQGAQSASRFRGIGRYSHALALAIANGYHDTHEIIIVLNEMLHETIEDIYKSFYPTLKKSNIKIWKGCAPVHDSDEKNHARIETSALLRESFLASLNPDIVLIMSVVEGYSDNSIISQSKHYNIPTAVIFYDAIPFMQAEKYIKPLGRQFEKYYYNKLEIIKNADLVFGISESSCNEAIEILHINEKKVNNISSAADSQFQPREYSNDEKLKLFKKLSISKPFLLYSGATDERKNHLNLIEAFSLLPKEIKNNYQLVLAGGIPLENHIRFKEKISQCKLSIKDVIFTGRISDEDFIALYNLCHLYVFPSYHEGFGLPALEAMQCGAATIGANTTSVPEVIGREDALFNPYNPIDISNKIESVLTNETFRITLKKHSLLHAKNFTWKSSASKLITVIEAWEKTTEKAHQKHFNTKYYIDNIITDIIKINNTKQDLLTISQSIAFNHPRKNHKQLLVDISELVNNDAKTGIQRVVRNILKQLLINPPQGYTVEPIYATSSQYGYRYAKEFTTQFLQKSIDVHIKDDPIEIGSHDIFLGLDMSPNIQISQAPYYQELRRYGIKVYFIIHDLLPYSNPEWWSDTPMGQKNAQSNFEKWLQIIIDTDGVICVSHATASTFRDWVKSKHTKKLNSFEIHVSHNGADIVSAETYALSDSEMKFIKKIKEKKTFIMVGTLEPRKAHLQTLHAFEKLWEDNYDINLIIVGKQGWLVESLVKTIEKHPNLNKKLFWLQGISDNFLDALYKSSTAIILSSKGEGFGLPLIEAAQKELPIIARDLPVFKEVAQEYAYYFPDTKDAVILEHTIKEWLVLYKNHQHPKSENMPWLTWKQSTEQLLACIIDKKSIPHA